MGRDTWTLIMGMVVPLTVTVLVLMIHAGTIMAGDEHNHDHSPSAKSSGMYATKAEAEAAATKMGCSGAHAMGNEWMPGSSHGACSGSKPKTMMVGGDVAKWTVQAADILAKGLSIPVGDKLMFQYGSSHDVYQMSSKEAFDACDFTNGNAKELADN